MARTIFIQSMCALLLWAITLPLHATTALTEKAKIEALIANLESKTDATFIRNGREYNSKDAAKFLRGKWQAYEKQIKTADDFIAKAATVSSTTGKPYLIRFKGAAEIRCGDHLTAQLKKLKAE